MSRRCRAGQRARVVASHPRNAGAIVLVVRRHFGEDVSGTPWAIYPFPWVVTSLGTPLRCVESETGEPTESKHTIVMDDSHLEPLEDDEARLDTYTSAERPVKQRS